MATGATDQPNSEVGEDCVEQGGGFSIIDILSLPDALRQLLGWMLREGEVTLPEVAAFIRQDEQAALQILDNLVDEGFLRKIEADYTLKFHLLLAHKTNRQINPAILAVLENNTDS